MKFSNRATRRRADKAALCFSRGTKVPGQIRHYLGDPVLSRIEAGVHRQAGKKISPDGGATVRFAPKLVRRMLAIAFRSAGFAPA